MATPPLTTSRRVPPTVTLKSPGTGTEPVSRFSLKVIVSEGPTTAAPEKVGGLASFGCTPVASATSPTCVPLTPVTWKS